uniref:Uncharacterized protein n=1 Tax=Lotharella globosa TaxID=91324 RepID=A0A7S3Z7M5_9EUKA
MVIAVVMTNDNKNDSAIHSLMRSMACVVFSCHFPRLRPTQPLRALYEMRAFSNIIILSFDSVCAEGHVDFDSFSGQSRTRTFLSKVNSRLSYSIRGGSLIEFGLV